jgi:hypothetical protein
LESCHSTWVFDAGRRRFCRVVKGIAVGQQRVSTEWRPYWELEIDPRGETFTVFLNESGTRVIGSSIHTQECVRCGGHHTTEVSLEDLHRAVA